MFIGLTLLFVLVQLVFFPYVWGDRTIQESTVAAQSLYSTGSRFPAAVDAPASRVLDAAAPAWQTEPQFALEHAIVFGQHTAPLWNPYSAFGTPLAAEMLSQPYSPFAWIPIAHPSARTYGVYVALRILAAGIFLLLFLRLFVGLVPALAGAVALMFAGCFWLYITMPELSVEVVTPAMLYAAERLLRRPSAGSAALFALSLGFCILGGMPESCLLVVTFVYVYAGARIATDPAMRARFRRIAGYGTAASVAGVGCAAILLVPFLEYIGLSWSTHPADTSVGLNGDTFSIGWLALYAAPLLNGPPWNNIFLNFNGGAGLRGIFYCGGTFFALLAAMGTFGDAVRRRPGNAPEAIFAIIALVLLLKRFACPLVNWIGGIPSFNRVDFAKYEETVIACCIAALVGFGVDRLVYRRAGIALVVAAVAIPGAIIVAAAFANAGSFASVVLHPEYYVLSLTAAGIFLAVAAALGVVALRTRIPGLNIGVAALTLVVVEPLAVWVIPLYYVINPQAPQSASALLGAPYIGDLKARMRDGSRFFAEDGVLYPEWSAAFGIADVRELDGLLPGRFLPFVRAFMPKEMSEELASRFVGAGDIDFEAPLVRRFLTLSSVRFVGLNHPPPGSSLLATATRAHPELLGSVIDGGYFTIGGDTRPGLFMHPATASMPRTEIPLRIAISPSTTDLRFAIGLLPAVWSGAICGDGVTFAIDRVAGTRTLPLFRKYIDPKHDPALRRWVDIDVPVTALRGKAVELRLATEPGPSGSNCADWAVWGNMRLLPAPKSAAAYPLALLRSEPGAQIYQFADPLPRVSIFHAVSHAADEADALRLVTDPALDIRRTAVVESNDPRLADIRQPPNGNADTGRIDVYGPNLVQATVTATVPSLVMLNDTNFPGWRAEVDAVPARIIATDDLFRGVIVGPGKHTIVYRYEPRSFRIGALVSALSLAAIGAAAIRPLVGHRRLNGVPATRHTQPAK